MRWLPFLSLFILNLFGNAQTLRRVASFPSELNEISGMVLLQDKILAIPDGGNPPFLYITDTSGTLWHKVYIEGGNQDWEEISLSGDSILYIGDFGNNDNTRQNLSILKIRFEAQKMLKFEYDSLKSERIEFSYANQLEFPPSQGQLNFDAEAMVCVGDSIWIFTKNRTAPYTGWTYLYKLSTQPGKYAITCSDSFQNATTVKELSWITGACVTTFGDLILLSSDHALRFDGYNFRVPPQRLSFSHISQKESLFYGFNNNLWISDEKNPLLPAGLFEFHLPESNSIEQKQPENSWFSILHNGIKPEISGHLRIIGINGQIQFDETIEQGVFIDLGSVRGPVIFELDADGRIFRSSWIKFNSIP